VASQPIRVSLSDAARSLFKCKPKGRKAAARRTKKPLSAAEKARLKQRVGLSEGEASELIRRLEAHNKEQLRRKAADPRLAESASTAHSAFGLTYGPDGTLGRIFLRELDHSTMTVARSVTALHYAVSKTKPWLKHNKSEGEPCPTINTVDADVGPRMLMLAKQLGVTMVVPVLDSVPVAEHPTFFDFKTTGKTAAHEAMAKLTEHTASFVLDLVSAFDIDVSVQCEQLAAAIEAELEREERRGVERTEVTFPTLENDDGERVFGVNLVPQHPIIRFDGGGTLERVYHPTYRYSKADRDERRHMRTLLLAWRAGKEFGWLFAELLDASKDVAVTAALHTLNGEEPEAYVALLEASRTDKPAVAKALETAGFDEPDRRRVAAALVATDSAQYFWRKWLEAISDTVRRALGGEAAALATPIAGGDGVQVSNLEHVLQCVRSRGRLPAGEQVTKALLGHMAMTIVCIGNGKLGGELGGDVAGLSRLACNTSAKGYSARIVPRFIEAAAALGVSYVHDSKSGSLVSAATAELHVADTRAAVHELLAARPYLGFISAHAGSSLGGQLGGRASRSDRGHHAPCVEISYQGEILFPKHQLACRSEDVITHGTDTWELQFSLESPPEGASVEMTKKLRALFDAVARANFVVIKRKKHLLRRTVFVSDGHVDWAPVRNGTKQRNKDAVEEVLSDLKLTLLEPEVYCTCAKPYDSTQFYVGCDRCAGWFHPECVNTDEATVTSCKTWACPSCESGEEVSEPVLNTNARPRPHRLAKGGAEMQEGELDDGRSPTRTSKLREGTVGVGGPSRGRKRTLDESEVSSEVSVNSAATRPNKQLHTSRTRRSSSAGTRSVNNVPRVTTT